MGLGLIAGPVIGGLAGQWSPHAPFAVAAALNALNCLGEDRYHWDAAMVGLSLAAFARPRHPAFRRARQRHAGLAGRWLRLRADRLRDAGLDGVSNPVAAGAGRPGRTRGRRCSQQAGASRQGQLQGSLASLAGLTSVIGPLCVTALCRARPGLERLALAGRRGAEPGRTGAVAAAGQTRARPVRRKRAGDGATATVTSLFADRPARTGWRTRPACLHWPHCPPSRRLAMIRQDAAFTCRYRAPGSAPQGPIRYAIGPAYTGLTVHLQGDSP